MIIGGRSSEMLTKTLGPTRVVENEIYNTYAECCWRDLGLREREMRVFGSWIPRPR
jgi:hypothetical protein